MLFSFVLAMRNEQSGQGGIGTVKVNAQQSIPTSIQSISSFAAEQLLLYRQNRVYPSWK
jgi:hypothetical protein